MATRLTSSDVQIGTKLPWPVYDREGHLLLREGYVVHSDKQLARLLHGGLYRRPESHKTPPRTKAKASDTQQSPFQQLEDIVLRLGRLLDAALDSPPDFHSRISRIVDQLIEVCQKDPDAALGFVQLYHDAPYTHCHPLKIAIVSNVIAQRMGIEAAAVRSLTGACLTCNISMVELQNVLQVQTDPITSDEQAEIFAHPVDSALLLDVVGVTDGEWLRAVREHHERCDGTGYPQQLKGEAISPLARILAVSDRYAASISSRAYRKTLNPGQAVKSLFAEHHNGSAEYDSQVVQTLVKVVGIYPPGSSVNLANGETAIVIRRNYNSAMTPFVAAVASSVGRPYTIPFRRDTTEPLYRITTPAAAPCRTVIPIHELWGYGRSRQA